jgi:hypothetical protein
MTLLRRFLVLAVFAYWQGGFTFYAAVVVPTGAEVLGSSAEQARITRLVAASMNLTGAVALAIFAWDSAMTHKLRRSRVVAVLFAALLLIALMILREHLDQMFHAADAYLDDRRAFRPWHRTYLWISTVQWASCVAYLILSIAAWRGEDRTSAASSP